MNGLPNVDVRIGNGNLGRTTQTEDGVVGLCITGSTVAGADNVTINTAYQIFSLDEAEALGITEGSTNDYAWQQLKDYYNEAATGAELWFMLTGQSVTMTDVADPTEDYAQELLTKAKGRVRILGISRKSAAGVTASGGMDGDVHSTVPNAQILAENFTGINRPLRVVIDGKDFTGEVADLVDYSLDTKNRVSIAISNADGSKNAAIGLLLGRIAASPVQRYPGRVRDGANVAIEAFFTNGADVENLEAAWDAIHNKGYVFLRSFVGKAGYFWNGASTLTGNTDDYGTIPRGRVIDKAHILAYSTFIEEILSEIPIDGDGKIHPALVKQWETRIENTINQQMAANGEVSAVSAFIDADQNVLSTDEIEVDLSILPVGYAEFITINLGFTTEINSN